jgi:hypothetical protein
LKALTAPELLLIDPMAPLDFAVLLGPSGPNVSMPDPSGFDPQHKGEGEFLPVVTLQPLDGEREGPVELREEREARAVMQPPVEPQHAEAPTAHFHAYVSVLLEYSKRWWARGLDEVRYGLYTDGPLNFVEEVPTTARGRYVLRTLQPNADSGGTSFFFMTVPLMTALLWIAPSATGAWQESL